MEAAPETAQPAEPVAEVAAESVTAPEPAMQEPAKQPEPAAEPPMPMAAPELPVEQPEAPAEPAPELPPDVAKAKGKARKRGKDKEPPAQLLFKDLL